MYSLRPLTILDIHLIRGKKMILSSSNYAMEVTNRDCAAIGGLLGDEDVEVIPWIHCWEIRQKLSGSDGFTAAFRVLLDDCLESHGVIKKES